MRLEVEMSLVAPIRNLWEVFAKTSEGVSSIVGVASERGMMGALRELLGLSPEGLKGQVDAILGVGIIQLLNEGDRRGVNTALSYREYTLGFLDEMKQLGDVLYKFSSEDLDQTNEAVEEMKAFLGDKESKYGRSKRERELESELQSLRERVREISELTEGGQTEESPSFEE
jgi:hypothetical protein